MLLTTLYVILAIIALLLMGYAFFVLKKIKSQIDIIKKEETKILFLINNMNDMMVLIKKISDFFDISKTNKRKKNSPLDKKNINVIFNKIEKHQNMIKSIFEKGKNIFSRKKDE